MKKTQIMFKKENGRLAPSYLHQFQAIQKMVKEGKWIQVVFSDVKKAKSNRQLGYLYAKPPYGIYQFMVSQFQEAWGGALYEVEKFGCTIQIENNITNVDIMMKMLYCNKAGIKSFDKTTASEEDLAKYITFLDEFSITNFGYCIPDTNKGE